MKLIEIIIVGVFLRLFHRIHANAENDTVPSRPRHLEVLNATAHSVTLKWKEPMQKNGKIKEYIMYYKREETTDVAYVKDNLTPEMVYILQNLEPFSVYKISLAARNENGLSAQTEEIDAATEISGASAPEIVNATCIVPGNIFIHWKRPLTFNRINFYNVSVKSGAVPEFFASRVKSFGATTDEMVTLNDLDTGRTYEIEIFAVSKSILDPTVMVKGNSSKVQNVVLTDGCEELKIVVERDNWNYTAYLLSCLVFIIGLCGIAFFVWRKYCKGAYCYLRDGARAVPATTPDWMETTDGQFRVPCHLFPKHVAHLHADGGFQFSRQYETIQATRNPEFTTQGSQHPDNRDLNRYLNILAYDHTRVQLLPVPGETNSPDYINANYIDGFQCSNAYIATQGPLSNTFDCFWRMVWEQGVAVIVMITNLTERARTKCDKYWPMKGVETYGVIEVQLIKEDVMATYTVRKLQIQNLSVTKQRDSEVVREVYQYHYTNWPDHGVPDHPLPILSFVKKSSAANPAGAGPIIVHCSAGVGRTGTYIVLDAMLKQIKHSREINVFGFLKHIRTQRNFLVQTEDQYVFVHDALVEEIKSGETDIKSACLSHYIQSLHSCRVADDDTLEAMTLLDQQFELVRTVPQQDVDYESAEMSCNESKNRSMGILPIENSRVILTPKAGVDGSDYINATWLQGFSRLREFIVTQHPLKSTTVDFWRMIWDHNAQTIILLSNLEEWGINKFWPQWDDEISTDDFRVKFKLELEQSGYVVNVFTIQSVEDDYEMTVKMMMCCGWPHCSDTLSTAVELIPVVQEWSSCQSGPMVVIDRFGGVEAATFCILLTLSKQLNYEKSADVYMYARLLYNHRPGIWQNKNEFLFIYTALDTLVGRSAGTSSPEGSAGPSDAGMSLNGHINTFENVTGTGDCCVQPEEIEQNSST